MRAAAIGTRPGYALVEPFAERQELDSRLLLRSLEIQDELRRFHRLQLLRVVLQGRTDIAVRCFEESVTASTIVCNRAHNPQRPANINPTLTQH